MRTTLVLDDRVLRRAKELAARRGISLGELVNQSLRAILAGRPANPGHFTMTTYGSPARPVAHEPADLFDAVDGDDRVALGR